MDDEVARFWREFEEETGERVQAKALGELCEDDGEQGIWFLLVLTDRSFWFKQVPNDNWLTSILRPRTLSLKRGEDYTLRIPREDLLSLTEPGKTRRSWFSAPVLPPYTLHWREGEATRSRRFSLHPPTELLPRLRELLP